MIGDRLLSQLCNLIEYVFGCLLNQNFVELLLLGYFVLHLEIGCSQLVGIYRNTGTGLFSGEDHASGMAGVFRHSEVKVLLLAFLN